MHVAVAFVPSFVFTFFYWRFVFAVEALKQVRDWLFTFMSIYEGSFLLNLLLVHAVM